MSKFKVGDKVRYLGTKEGRTDDGWENYFGKYGIKKGSTGIIDEANGKTIFVKNDGRSNTFGRLFAEDLELVSSDEGMSFEDFRAYVKKNGLTKAKTTEEFDVDCNQIPKGTVLYFNYTGNCVSSFNESTNNKNKQFGYKFDYSWAIIWGSMYKGKFVLVEEEALETPVEKSDFFKDGETIVCVNSKDKHLTNGKEYVVSAIQPDYKIDVIDDRGLKRLHHERRFKHVVKNSKFNVGDKVKFVGKKAGDHVPSYETNSPFVAHGSCLIGKVYEKTFAEVVGFHVEDGNDYVCVKFPNNSKTHDGNYYVILDFKIDVLELVSPKEKLIEVDMKDIKGIDKAILKDAEAAAAEEIKNEQLERATAFFKNKLLNIADAERRVKMASDDLADAKKQKTAN